MNLEDWIKVDYNDRCKCDDRSGTYRVNYEIMWGEADIMCSDCKKFVRFWDAG